MRRVLTNFEALDKDGDGHLTAGEFREGLGMLGMDEGFCRLVFDTFDTQGDGRIDQREFVTNMAVMLHPENLEAQISLAFDAYDVNKDGKLTEGELRQVIACVFSALDKMGLTNEHSSEDVADELFKQLDADGKGHVTKADYVRLCAHEARHLPPDRARLASPMSQRRSRRVGSVSPASDVLASSGGDGDRGTDGTSASSSGRLRTRRGRKRGNTVTFGHQNFELVVQMMLGIRLAAGKANEAPPPDLAQLQASRSHSMKAREREQREAGASTAAQPAAAAAGAGASEELPAGWSRGTDDSGHPFYRHAQTKEVRYTRPRRRSADLSGSSSSGSHRGGVVDDAAAASSTPHDGSDWHYAEPSIVILKKRVRTASAASRSRRRRTRSVHVRRGDGGGRAGGGVAQGVRRRPRPRRQQRAVRGLLVGVPRDARGRRRGAAAHPREDLRPRLRRLRQVHDPVPHARRRPHRRVQGLRAAGVPQDPRALRRARARVHDESRPGAGAQF